MQDEIKLLQNEMICVSRQVTGCDRDCLHCNNLVLEEAEIIAAYNIAIESLRSKSEAEEYRTPKKPDSVRYRDHIQVYSYDGGCPKCGGFVDYRMDKYCRHCGQALDWSEVEE